MNILVRNGIKISDPFTIVGERIQERFEDDVLQVILIPVVATGIIQLPSEREQIGKLRRFETYKLIKTIDKSRNKSIKIVVFKQYKHEGNQIEILTLSERN